MRHSSKVRARGPTNSGDRSQEESSAEDIYLALTQLGGVPKILATLQSGRRVTLPEDWCNQEHVMLGDPLLIEYTEDLGTIIIAPAEIKRKT